MTLPPFDLGDDHYLLATRFTGLVDDTGRHPSFDQPQKALPAQVRQDNPGRASSGDQVLVHTSLAPFGHPQGDDTERKCPTVNSTEKFAGK